MDSSLPKSWAVIEKVIAVVLTLLGGFSLYIIINYISFMVSIFRYPLNFFIAYHVLCIASLLSLIAGVFLFLNKKLGWLMAIVVSFLETLIWISSFMNHKVNSADKVDFWVTILFVLMLGTIPVLLINKHFRNKYQPSKKTWIIISLITVVLALDQYILEFSHK